MIDLVVVKRGILRYVQDVRWVRGMGRGLSDHHVVLRKVRLVGAWIKRRAVVVGARRIRNEKLREHQRYVWKRTEKRRGRLKSVYIRSKRK